MPVRFRRFGHSELEDVGRVFAAALNDLLTSIGVEPYVDIGDEDAWRRVWKCDRRDLFEHLNTHSCQSWLAEQDGAIVGYARSILRDGMCQLTEFFVLPNKQSMGVGTELFQRAYASVEARTHTILSTTHPAAMARYLKSGVYPVCPVFGLERVPNPVPFETDLETREIDGRRETLELLNMIDSAVLGYQRTVDHEWLMEHRRGSLYFRQNKPVGYGYVGRWSGPFALLQPTDFPVVLAHAETAAAERQSSLTLLVPLANRTATSYLLGRGFKFDDGFVSLFMTDAMRLRLDSYVCAMPGFFT